MQKQALGGGAASILVLLVFSFWNESNLGILRPTWKANPFSQDTSDS